MKLNWKCHWVIQKSVWRLDIKLSKYACSCALPMHGWDDKSESMVDWCEWYTYVSVSIRLTVNTYLFLSLRERSIFERNKNFSLALQIYNNTLNISCHFKSCFLFVRFTSLAKLFRIKKRRKKNTRGLCLSCDVMSSIKLLYFLRFYISTFPINHFGYVLRIITTVAAVVPSLLAGIVVVATDSIYRKLPCMWVYCVWWW